MSSYGATATDYGHCREFRAETVSEAIKLACAELEVHPEDLVYEVKDSGLLNILGFDSGLASILVFRGISDGSPDQAIKGSGRELASSNGHFPGEANSEIFEATARKYGLSYREVVSNFASGKLEFSPDRQRLRFVETHQAESAIKKPSVHSERNLDRVPTGYWSETDDLIVRLRCGEETLLWDIVLRLEPIISDTVDKVLEDHRPNALHRDDLLQIGRIEIIGLIRSYQPQSGTRIYLYMRQWLYHKIVRAIRNSSFVRVPINCPNSELEQRADHFTRPCTYESLNRLPEDSVLSDESGFAEMMYSDLYGRVMQRATLSERQWYVLSHRYGLNGKPEMTLEQVGAALDLTRERVRQIQVEAVKRIRYEFYLSFSKESRSRSMTSDPKSVCPAIVRGDFPLDAFPEPEHSISAAHEWPGDIFPLRKTLGNVAR